MKKINLANLAMAQKLHKGEAIDVSEYPRDGKFYILPEFEEDKEYCDAVAEIWIWSIGLRKSDNKILASTGTEFYQNMAFDCLWLR